MRPFYKFAAIVFFANFALLTYFVYDGAIAFYDFVKEEFDQFFYGEDPMAEQVLGQITITTLWAGSLLVAFVALFLRSNTEDPEIELTESDYKSLEETAEASNHEANEEARKEREALQELHAKQQAAADELLGQFEGKSFENIEAEQLPERMLKHLANMLQAGQGLIYLRSEVHALSLSGAFAYIPDEASENRVEFGSGFVGEAARSQKMLAIEDMPNDYIRIVSGLGETIPEHLLVIPLVWDDLTLGVAELATFHVPDQFEKEAIKKIASRMSQLMYPALKDQTHIREAIALGQEDPEEALVAEQN